MRWNMGRRSCAYNPSLEAEVHHIASGWERELTIAFTNMLRSDALYDWLAQFYQLNSGTRVRIIREVYSGTWTLCTTNGLIW